MDELILSGHSFGGMAMVKTASSLPEQDKPKTLLVLDPSLYAFTEEILAGQYQVTCPIQVIDSAYFHSNRFFKSWATHKALLTGAKESGLQEHIRVDKTFHMG